VLSEFSVRRLTLWSRLWPPKLVGLLLHPVPRSGTRRRLTKFLADPSAAAGARPISPSDSPGRRLRLPSEEPIWRKSYCQLTTTKFYSKRGSFSSVRFEGQA